MHSELMKSPVHYLETSLKTVKNKVTVKILNKNVNKMKTTIKYYYFHRTLNFSLEKAVWQNDQY